MNPVGAPGHEARGLNHQLTNKKVSNFSENLMNMLALQNIGHVFSENPVEALNILKDKDEDKKKRKNSGLQKGSGAKASEFRNSSFILQPQKQPLANYG
jgi:hypothetical protein